MKIAYLVNQYPRLSHSFIRREIAAMEASGATILRFSMRGWTESATDPHDREEQLKTRVILGAGALRMGWAMLLAVLLRPVRFWRAARCAWRVGKRSERGRLIHLVYLMEACILLRWLARDNVSHVHAHFGTNSTTVAMLLWMLGGPPYSFTSHGPEEYDQPRFIALGEKIQHARFVVAISDYGRSQLYRWCEYKDWGKIHVVRCGVDEMFLDAGSDHVKDVTADNQQLVCVGRLCEQKGQLLLVQAMAQLSARNVPCHLTLVGDGEMRPAIEALIDKLNLRDRITLAGSMNSQQVRQRILDSRALVLPSFAEGLPVVIMEALALRRAVLSTYVAGIPELVVPGECGWLVPPGSVDALADALERVMRAAPDELNRMGEAGAARVRQNHDVRIEAAKLLELIHRSAAAGT